MLFPLPVMFPRPVLYREHIRRGRTMGPHPHAAPGLFSMLFPQPSIGCNGPAVDKRSNRQMIGTTTIELLSRKCEIRPSSVVYHLDAHIHIMWQVCRFFSSTPFSANVPVTKVDRVQREVLMGYHMGNQECFEVPGSLTVRRPRQQHHEMRPPFIVRALIAIMIES